MYQTIYAAGLFEHGLSISSLISRPSFPIDHTAQEEAVSERRPCLESLLGAAVDQSIDRRVNQSKEGGPRHIQQGTSIRGAFALLSFIVYHIRVGVWRGRRRHLKRPTTPLDDDGRAVDCLALASFRTASYHHHHTHASTGIHTAAAMPFRVNFPSMFMALIRGALGKRRFPCLVVSCMCGGGYVHDPSGPCSPLLPAL
jgi:hypothetical protein